VTIVILSRFSRRDYHFSIFFHVSKVVTFFKFHLSAQGFKLAVTFSLCFTRPSWITLLCMTFKVVYVPIVSSTIHIFMSHCH
jgi:hypothetical protein